MPSQPLPRTRTRTPCTRPSPTIRRSHNTTAAVLAGADHDLQIWRRPNVSYGEAVGITQFQAGSAATPRQSRFLEHTFRLAGQFLSGPMAAAMIDLAAGNSGS